MRYGLCIILITLFLMYNTYYDNKITSYMKKNIKYLKMGGIMFIGLSLYLFLKKHPGESKNMMKYAIGAIKYLPIDKNSKDLLTPILNYTHSSNDIQDESILRPMRNTNLNQIHKRSVSETKKKYVASNQNWCCNHCNQKLDATFEVDHVIELQNGGTNDVSNLVALCRNCHGKKSMLQRL